MNIFTKVVDGLKWVGKEAEKAILFVPKIITIVDDVEEDAVVLLPEAVAVFTDAEGLVVAAIKDGGHVVSAAQVMWLAIEQAAAAKALNVAEDEAVIAAFQGFITTALSSGTWPDVLTALSKLTADWDTFGASAKAALAKLEADVK